MPLFVFARRRHCLGARSRRSRSGSSAFLRSPLARPLGPVDRGCGESDSQASGLLLSSGYCELHAVPDPQLFGAGRSAHSQSVRHEVHGLQLLRDGTLLRRQQRSLHRHDGS